MSLSKRMLEAGYRPAKAGKRQTAKKVTSKKALNRGYKVFSWSIEGLPQVTAALNSFEPKHARKALAKATRESAKIVLVAALNLVPVLTGALRDSLKVRAFAKPKRKISAKTVGASVQTSDGWFKGATFYGGFIELGTDHITAREYMRGALRNTEDEARTKFKQALTAAVAAAGQTTGGAP